MQIKTIFKIVIAIGLLQIMPLIISLFSPEFSSMLTTDTFGFTPSDDAMLMFENFALVLSFMFIGIIFHMIGAMSFNDESVLRRLSFLYFVLFGFLSLTDLDSLFSTLTSVLGFAPFSRIFSTIISVNC